MLKGRLRHLQMVVTVARVGSMQRAARELAVSQPAITKAVSEIETDIGIILFDRLPRGIRLTRSGQVVVPLMERILEATDLLAQGVAVQRNSGSSILRVASVAAGISGVLASLAPAFCRANPDIVLRVDEVDGRHMLGLAARDEFDIFVCRPPETTPDGWTFTPVQKDEHAVMASPSHPLAGKSGLTVDDLHGCTWLMPPAGVPAEALLAVLFDGLPPPRMVQLPTRSRTLNRAAIQDLGLVSAAPISIFRAELANQTLARLDFRLESSMPPLGLLRPQVSTGSAMDRFVSFVERAARQAL
ncbi:LysR substrate-binding domain-containing protein [Pararhodobacter zhoushanensis]|uniref:LysR substrate-binding domain-containing protein n=2 Tax=Pararhodobacter zhoushanensis TaxID=2479545 RepID=A0ABT3GXL2_9RHOB|nr:LysR substrate-binding domain-containing protein [Pararhodobacter zhoushanensis]